MDTNYTSVDVSEGYKVNGVTVIDSSGNLTATAGSVGTAELAADAVTGAKLADDAVSLEHLDDGILPGFVVRSASRHTWNEAAAASDVVTVTGVDATDVILATINVRGTNSPTTVLSAERSGADSVTVTLDQNGENGVTVVSVIALRVAA